MNMAMPKKYLAGIVIALIAFAAVAAFFYYFGRHDAVALSDFLTAYAKYDQAAADFSRLSQAPAENGLERSADQALAVLNARASVRISSLTRNDADLMTTMLEIGSLSTKELAALKEYKTALADGSSDVGQVANVYADLTNKRQAAYTQFRELAGLKN